MTRESIKEISLTDIGKDITLSISGGGGIT